MTELRNCKERLRDGLRKGYMGPQRSNVRMVAREKSSTSTFYDFDNPRRVEALGGRSYLPALSGIVRFKMVGCMY